MHPCEDLLNHQLVCDPVTGLLYNACPTGTSCPGECNWVLVTQLRLERLIHAPNERQQGLD